MADYTPLESDIRAEMKDLILFLKDIDKFLFRLPKEVMLTQDLNDIHESIRRRISLYLRNTSLNISTQGNDSRSDESFEVHQLPQPPPANKKKSKDERDYSSLVNTMKKKKITGHQEFKPPSASTPVKAPKQNFGSEEDLNYEGSDYENVDDDNEEQDNPVSATTVLDLKAAELNSKVGDEAKNWVHLSTKGLSLIKKKPRYWSIVYLNHLYLYEDMRSAAKYAAINMRGAIVRRQGVRIELEPVPEGFGKKAKKQVLEVENEDIASKIERVLLKATVTIKESKSEDEDYDNTYDNQDYDVPAVRPLRVIQSEPQESFEDYINDDDDDEAELRGGQPPTPPPPNMRRSPADSGGPTINPMPPWANRQPPEDFEGGSRQPATVKASKLRARSGGNLEMDGLADQDEIRQPRDWHKEAARVPDLSGKPKIMPKPKPVPRRLDLGPVDGGKKFNLQVGGNQQSKTTSPNEKPFFDFASTTSTPGSLKANSKFGDIRRDLEKQFGGASAMPPRRFSKGADDKPNRSFLGEVKKADPAPYAEPNSSFLYSSENWSKSSQSTLSTSKQVPPYSKVNFEKKKNRMEQRGGMETRPIAPYWKAGAGDSTDSDNYDNPTDYRDEDEYEVVGTPPGKNSRPPVQPALPPFALSLSGPQSCETPAVLFGTHVRRSRGPTAASKSSSSRSSLDTSTASTNGLPSSNSSFSDYHLNNSTAGGGGLSLDGHANSGKSAFAAPLSAAGKKFKSKALHTAFTDRLHMFTSGYDRSVGKSRL